MDNDKIQEFLNRIAQIESAGGKNTDHPIIESGMHKGQHAIGTYGLMPKTIDELASNATNPELQLLKTLSDSDKQLYLQKNPEIEQILAKQLAQKVLGNQNGDEEKAAYSWLHGHNLSSDKIEQKDYKSEPYVQKYDKLSGQPITERKPASELPSYILNNPTASLNENQKTDLASQLSGLSNTSLPSMPMADTGSVNGFASLLQPNKKTPIVPIEEEAQKSMPKIAVPDSTVSAPQFGSINNLIASYLRKK